MQSPMPHERCVVADHSVMIAGVAIDLYRAPRGAGWWTPADPILTIASVPDAEHLDFLRQHGMTNVLHGYEVIWDSMRPEHRRHVAILSPNAAAAVLMNARRPVDPATVAAIDAALAG